MTPARPGAICRGNSVVGIFALCPPCWDRLRGDVIASQGLRVVPIETSAALRYLERPGRVWGGECTLCDPAWRDMRSPGAGLDVRELTAETSA